MRDQETRSEWLHYTGECIAGPLAGRTLPMLDGSLLSWKSFRTLYPEATVAPPTNAWWRRVAGRIETKLGLFHLTGMFRRTMRAPDARLPEQEFGLGIVVGRRSLVGGARERAARFFPNRLVRERGLINDRVGDLPVVVAFDPVIGAGSAFAATLDGATLAFAPAGEGRFRDGASGSEFDLAGRAVTGPLAGRRLAPAPALSTRWYGFVQTYPGASIAE